MERWSNLTDIFELGSVQLFFSPKYLAPNSRARTSREFNIETGWLEDCFPFREGLFFWGYVKLQECNSNMNSWQIIATSISPQMVLNSKGNPLSTSQITCYMGSTSSWNNDKAWQPSNQYVKVFTIDILKFFQSHCFIRMFWSKPEGSSLAPSNEEILDTPILPLI